jgi:hypothetical protein
MRRSEEERRAERQNHLAPHHFVTATSGTRAKTLDYLESLAEILASPDKYPSSSLAVYIADSDVYPKLDRHDADATYILGWLQGAADAYEMFGISELLRSEGIADDILTAPVPEACVLIRAALQALDNANTKQCVKCDAVITAPTLAASVAERCAKCGDYSDSDAEVP